MEIGLVSCSKTKLDSKNTPRNLYSASTLFEKASHYAEQTHDKWFILSAKHGLLSPDGPVIKPYDETLADSSIEERQAWGENVLEDLKERQLMTSDTEFVIHAGKNYYETLVPLLEKSDVSYRIPTEGLRFGKTLAWYNDALNSE